MQKVIKNHQTGLILSFFAGFLPFCYIFCNYEIFDNLLFSLQLSFSSLEPKENLATAWPNTNPITKETSTSAFNSVQEAKRANLVILEDLAPVVYQETLGIMVKQAKEDQKVILVYEDHQAAPVYQAYPGSVHRLPAR